jgi:hypothetical protein
MHVAYATDGRSWSGLAITQPVVGEDRGPEALRVLERRHSDRIDAALEADIAAK